MGWEEVTLTKGEQTATVCVVFCDKKNIETLEVNMQRKGEELPFGLEKSYDLPIEEIFLLSLKE